MRTLTNYDRYVLAKQGNEENIETNTKVETATDEYGAYLLNELRRTVPSENKVLKENEFYEMRNGASEAPAAAVAKERKFHLKKKGKIFLTVYVILMLALASILIVSNTAGTRTSKLEGISFNQSAGAAPSSENVSDKGTIRAMTVEDEESEETNWFDKLCDSLNK